MASSSTVALLGATTVPGTGTFLVWYGTTYRCTVPMSYCY